MTKLSPQMQKLLDLMGDEQHSVSTIEVKFYGLPKGTYGYVNKGRGGGLTATFQALERRGLIERVPGTGRYVRTGVNDA